MNNLEKVKTTLSERQENLIIEFITFWCLYLLQFSECAKSAQVTETEEDDNKRTWSKSKCELYTLKLCLDWCLSNELSHTCFNATPTPAIAWLCGPPWRDGNTAKSMFLSKSYIMSEWKSRTSPYFLRTLVICINLIWFSLSLLYLADTQKKRNNNLNPLSPKSDLLLISPYNITPESNIKVRGIKEMITNS